MTEKTAQPRSAFRGLFLSVHEALPEEAQSWAENYCRAHPEYAPALAPHILPGHLTPDDIEFENPFFYVGRPPYDIRRGWYAHTDSQSDMNTIEKALFRTPARDFRWNNTLFLPKSIRKGPGEVLQVQVVLDKKTGKPMFMCMTEADSPDRKAQIALIRRTDKNPVISCQGKPSM